MRYLQLLLLLLPGCLASPVSPTHPPQVADSYPSPPREGGPLLSSLNASWQGDTIVIAMNFEADPGELNAEWTGQVWLDVDNNPDTGYHGFGQGSDRAAFLQELSRLEVPIHIASESGNDEDWAVTGAGKVRGGPLRVYVPLSALGYKGGVIRCAAFVYSLNWQQEGVSSATTKLPPPVAISGR